MKLLKKLFAIVCVLSLLSTSTVFAQEDNHLKELPFSAESMFFNMVFADVVDMYQFEVDDNEIYQRMIQNMLTENPEMMDVFFKALFASFDDYSEFYTAEEFEAMQNSLDGVFGGIGVYLEKRPQYVCITSVMTGTPAAVAGVRSGDLICAIDGESVVDRSLEYVSTMLRGDVGTTVLVTVLRGEETLEFAITRAEITASSVTWTVLGTDTAYLSISSFSSTAAKDVKNALAQIDALGIKKLILDLRDNGGGYVDSAIEIAREFVPQGTIISHYTKVNGQSLEYKSYLKAPKYTMVTLVNGNTASASEILASALQDSGVSKLVGKRTFGKAVTQSVFPLYADRGCKLTTGEYFSRNGNKINMVGIKPDVDVNNVLTDLENTDTEPLRYCTSYVPGTTEEGISAFKARLRYLNYDVGELDNYYSDTFKEAVKAYQAANYIKATGELDLITQIHITNTTDEIEVMVDAQLNEAARLIKSDYKGLALKE